VSQTVTQYCWMILVITHDITALLLAAVTQKVPLTVTVTVTYYSLLTEGYLVNGF